MSRRETAHIRVAYLVALLAILFVPAGSLSAAENDPNQRLPRFVSLRSDLVNLRVGPGENYPIEWVLTRKEMPVEIVREFEHWRMIRDWQGTEGWVHQSMLSARRMVVITQGRKTLKAEPDDKAAALAELDTNVVARLLTCPRDKNFCKVEVQNFQGWLRRDEFWGVYPGEYIE